MHRLSARLRERHIELELTPAAQEILIQHGYDPAFGARPLKRVIQREILDPLALGLLRGDYRDGDSVVVDAHRGELLFRRVEERTEAAAATA
jgi:ATP-dependent Clp protease ATP-binding subunit ClpB